MEKVHLTSPFGGVCITVAMKRANVPAPISTWATSSHLYLSFLVSPLPPQGRLAPTPPPPKKTSGAKVVKLNGCNLTITHRYRPPVTIA